MMRTLSVVVLEQILQAVERVEGLARQRVRLGLFVGVAAEAEAFLPYV